MKKNIFYFLILLIFSSACGDYLDIVPDNVATLDYAFRDRIRAEQYLFTCYSYLPNYLSANDPGLNAGDEIYSNPGRAKGSFPGVAFDLRYDGNDVDNPYFNFWDGARGGQALWRGIRACGIFIENIDNVRGMDSFEKEIWKAEAKFLKAYYHFYLMQLYGPIPIIRNNLPISSTPAEVAMYREPVDEVVNYIVELLDEATPFLPLYIINEVSELGRITQPICLTLKAKVLITAASPLFNGNKEYATLIDNRGIQLFNQTEIPEKWDRALKACKNAIDTCHLAGIRLYGINDIALSRPVSDSTKRVLLPGQIVTDKWNDEIIWGTAKVNSRNIEIFTAVPLTNNHRRALGVTLVPSFQMAELFYSNNGVPINEDKDFEYDNRYSLKEVPFEERYYMQPEYITVGLHLNREPRFYGSIAVDGGWFFGMGRMDEEEQWPINSRLGGTSGRQGVERYSPTSYYIKKLTSIRSTFSGETYIDYRWPIPIFRLADLYLLYAEALNEVSEYPTNEVYEYINLIRERTGLLKVEEAWTEHSIFPQKFQTKNGMRDIIHRERSIELAFEGQRFWDLRRWKEAIGAFDEPFLGWNIQGETPEEFYEIKTLKSAPYNLKDVLWPIRQSNLSVNNNLVQNIGW